MQSNSKVQGCLWTNTRGVKFANVANFNIS